MIIRIEYDDNRRITLCKQAGARSCVAQIIRVVRGDRLTGRPVDPAHAQCARTVEQKDRAAGQSLRGSIAPAKRTQ